MLPDQIGGGRGLLPQVVHRSDGVCHFDHEFLKHHDIEGEFRRSPVLSSLKFPPNSRKHFFYVGIETKGTKKRSIPTLVDLALAGELSDSSPLQLPTFRDSGADGVFDDRRAKSCLLSLTRLSVLRRINSLLFHWHLRREMAGALDFILLLLFGVVFRQKILNYVLEEETSRHLEAVPFSQTLQKIIHNSPTKTDTQLLSRRSKFTHTCMVLPMG